MGYTWAKRCTCGRRSGAERVCLTPNRPASAAAACCAGARKANEAHLELTLRHRRVPLELELRARCLFSTTPWMDLAREQDPDIAVSAATSCSLTADGARIADARLAPPAENTSPGAHVATCKLLSRRPGGAAKAWSPPADQLSLQAGSAINVLGLRARARATACSSRAADGLKYSQKLYFMSLYIRFSRSDSPTPCTGTRTESLALTHTCIAEAKMARRGRPRALPTLC